MFTIPQRTPATLRNVKRNDRDDPANFRFQLEVTVPSAALNDLAPDLESALFGPGRQGDLIEGFGRAAVRFPTLTDVHLEPDSTPQTLSFYSAIENGSAPDFEIACVCKNVNITPRDGGSCGVRLTLYGGENLPVLHAGALTLLSGRKVEIRLI